ncbi:hypothetical protein AO379_0323 [Moraxella catarrhalis]|uniref:Uncharacterized protein n=1 Tax=Moraxella catarrhalis TaxID=480 RepID=A0A7Z1A4J5_MORCA|nr:hypothetical protein AO382_0169 [Moraxella catarrhalis]OAV07170.1 hypothetical protein AO379_0323 [Moraxella catarrhalis]
MLAWIAKLLGLRLTVRQGANTKYIPTDNMVLPADFHLLLYNTNVIFGYIL